MAGPTWVEITAVACHSPETRHGEAVLELSVCLAPGGALNRAPSAQPYRFRYREGDTVTWSGVLTYEDGKWVLHSDDGDDPISVLHTGKLRPGDHLTVDRPREAGMTFQVTAINRQIATDETTDLIASSKVEGTAVFSPSGERLGSVYNFMVHKRSGQVAYAVMSFGGFMELGSDYHPLPWNQLTYDTRLGGYVISMTKEQLKQAPTYSDLEAEAWDDPAYGRKVDSYYGGLGR